MGNTTNHCRKMTGSDKTTELIQSWKIVFKNEMEPNGKAWVLFKHGTVVLIGDAQSVETVTEEAKKLMEQDGPVITGTPHGDFNMFDAPSVKGQIVTLHCPVIVLPSVVDDMSNPMIVGLTGRGMKDEDSKSLEVIYVQMPEA